MIDYSEKKNKKKTYKKNKSQYEKKAVNTALLRIGSFNRLLGVITYIIFKVVTSIRNRVLSQAQQKYQNRTMPAKRGTIYDRNGNILATSNKVYNVVLDCKAVNFR